MKSIKQWLIKCWENIVTRSARLKIGVIDCWKKIISWLANFGIFLKKYFKQAPFETIKFVKKILLEPTRFFKKIFIAIIEFFKKIFSAVGMFFRKIPVFIGNIFRNIFSSVGGFFGKIFASVANFLRNIFVAIRDFFKKAFAVISNFFRKTASALVAGPRWILSKIKNAFNNVVSRLISPFIHFKKIAKEVKKTAGEDRLRVARKDEKFITDSKAALMNEISPAADVTIITVVGFIFIAAIWAYFGEIDQTISGTGVVIPSSRVKTIQSLDGGILQEIYVTEGQMVQKDQKLLVMDDTRYKSEYQQLYEQYLALQAMVARLSAETQDKKDIIFPADLKNRPEIVESEERLFQTRRQSLKDEVAVLQQSYDFANKEIAMYAPLIKTGVSSQLELLRAERSANDIQSRIFEKQGKFREDAWEELNRRQGELAATKEKLMGLKDKMVHTTITSPVHGIIKKINVVTVGGVIQPAVNIMEIVPLGDTLLVQAKVNSADIAFVHIGATASVKIDAYDYSIYGDLKGTVEYISADIIEDTADRNASSARGAPRYYLVNVRTKQDYLLHHGEKLPIIPGMTANVQITVGKRTLLQYIFKPIIKAKSEALRER